MTAVLREDIFEDARATRLLNDHVVGATTLTVTAGGLATWGTPTNGRFSVVVDRGTATEEHLYGAAIAGDQITGITKVVGGTAGTAYAHDASATVEHGVLGAHIDRANELLSLPTTKGDLLVASAADNWARQGVGANDTVLVADSTQANGMRWTSAPAITDFTGMPHDHLDADDGGTLTAAAIPALVAAWTPYTTVLGGVTLGDGTKTGRFMQVGKTVHAAVDLTFGSTTSVTGGITFSLPVTAAVALIAGVATWYALDTSVPAEYLGVAKVSGTTVLTPFTPASPSVALGVGVPFTWANGDYLTCSVTYEAA